MNPTLPVPTVRSIDRLSQMMEELLPNRWEFNIWSPPVDIKETAKEYQILMDLPGMHREDIDVEVSRDVITVLGKINASTEEKGENFIRRERRHGEFKRSFKLDAPVRSDQVKAEFKNGVLAVHVPKIEPASPQKVAINA